MKKRKKDRKKDRKLKTVLQRFWKWTISLGEPQSPGNDY